MIFDLIISNPPYNRGLDIKILRGVESVAHKICAVHPSSWLVDKKDKSKAVDIKVAITE